jgi:ABC-type Fe3+-hydroxamate transport system substrate-binding protein
VPVLILLLLAAVAAFALGCQESGFDERKETARPLKVQHVKGESKVPGTADRVATLTLDTLDDSLALGVRPALAVVPGDSLPGYLRGPAAGVEAIRPVAAGELAALREARPDLIVGRQGALFEALSLIAPTVIVEPGSGRWKLNLRLMGEALGRTNDAEGLLSDYDRRVAAARTAVQGRPRVAVVRAVEDGWRFAPRDSFAGTILADVGVRQVGSFARADVVLLSQPQSERVQLGVDGRFSHEDVELATWWGPGGVIEARAALSDLQEIMRR